MSLGSIGQNGTEEFFETILYQTAYKEAQDSIKGFTKDIDSEILQDALQGAMSVVSMGLVFMLMRKQEDFIEGVFKTAEGLVVVLLGSSFAQKMGNKLGRLKGGNLFKKLSMFKSSYSDRVATAQLVVNHANTHFSAERTAQSETTTLQSVSQMKEHMVSKEKLHHAVGDSMASRYNETLMFKLFTKSFTSNDEILMKKILGRDTASELKVEDMNKVADFMFVTDSNGDVTGLTEQMFQLLNGMGYMNK